MNAEYMIIKSSHTVSYVAIAIVGLVISFFYALTFDMRIFLVKKTDLNVKKGYIDFASKIIGMIDRKAKAIRAKCWHNRSKFKQNVPSSLQ